MTASPPAAPGMQPGEELPLAVIVAGLRMGRMNRLTQSGRVVLDQEVTAGLMNLAATKIEELEARALSAEAKLAQAVEALEPLAEAAGSYDPDEGDGADVAWSHDFTIASLRRARTAASAIRGEKT
jgi:hypothetical protein